MNLLPFLIALLLAETFPGLKLQDPTVHPDDFLSISCPSPKVCFILDRTGNLFFSDDEGKNLAIRSDVHAQGLRQIRFSGLLDGLGLDGEGRIWQSRNAGRSFGLLATWGPGPSHANNLVAGPSNSLWVMSPNGTLWQWNGKSFQAVETVVPSPESIMSGDTGAIAVATRLGLGYFSTNGKDWQTIQLPPKTGIAAFWASPRGELAALGDTGEFFYEAGTRGQQWSRWPLPESMKKPQRGATPKGMFAPEGKLIIFGDDRQIWEGDPQRQKLQPLPLSEAAHWNDATWVGAAGIALVGRAGALARLEPAPKGALKFLRLDTPRPDIVDLQTLKGGRKAFRVLSGGAIEASVDGGGTWSAWGTPTQQPFRMQFQDERRVLMIWGEHKLAATNDGGRNWKPLGEWPDFTLIDVTFFDAVRGVAVGSGATVAKTMDAGKTWSVDRLSTEPLAFNRVQFVDGQRGWVVGERQAVFATQDGGQNWEQQLSGQGTLRALHFFPSGEGFVAGDNGLIMHSPDGGKSWVPQPLPTDKTIYVLSFIDPSRGLAAGEEGVLFLTHDKGTTWKQLDLRTRVPLTALGCWKETGRCMVGGGRGMFWTGTPFRY